MHIILTLYLIETLICVPLTGLFSYIEHRSDDKSIDNALMRAKSKIRGMIKTHPNLFPNIYDMFKKELDGRSDCHYMKNPRKWSLPKNERF